MDTTLHPSIGADATDDRAAVRSDVGQVGLAFFCLALGVATLAVLAFNTSGPLSSSLLGTTLFLGPGLVGASWSRRRVRDTAWFVFPASCAVVLLTTRALLAVELYRPAPIAAAFAAFVGLGGGARIIASWSDHHRSMPEMVAAALPRRPDRHRMSIRGAFTWWRTFVVAAAILSVVGSELTRIGDLAPLGLLGHVSPVWYLGTVMTVIAVIVAIKRSTPTNAAPLAVAAALVLLVLHGTAPLIYDSARYVWTYKHIGFADYFGRFHDNDRSAVDVYHAFPAFFSGLGVIAGTVSLKGLDVIARWWPLLIELASALAIRRLVGSFTHDKRVPMLAALSFLGVNWIGQDYLSPQSVSFVLALAIYALIFQQVRDRRTGEGPTPGQVAAEPRRARVEEWWTSVAICGLWTAIVVSHPLTPYMMLPGLLVGYPLFRLRPRGLPWLMALIAIGYSLLNFDLIRTQGFHNDLGNAVANVQPRGTTTAAAVSRVPEFDYYFLAAIALSFVIVVVAAFGINNLRRTFGRRRFLGILAQVVSPTLFLVVNSYGQEGVLRAFLFVAPWLCLSAAMLLERSPRPRPPTLDIEPWRRRRYTAAAMVVPVIVVGASVLSVTALFVRDQQYDVAASDVAVVRWFEESNPTGGLLIGAGVLPDRTTATYYRQKYLVVPAPLRNADGSIDATGTLSLLEQGASGFHRSTDIAFGPSLENRAIFDGTMSHRDLVTLESVVANDPDWQLVFADGASHLYHWRRA